MKKNFLNFQEVIIAAVLYCVQLKLSGRVFNGIVVPSLKVGLVLSDA